MVMVGTVSRGARRSPMPARARLRSCSGVFAGRWLSAVLASLALRKSNPERLCAACRRLGMRVDPLGERCEGCGRQVDAHDHHRAACTRTARACARRHTIVAALCQVFQEAGGQVLDKSLERMVQDTHVPASPGDARRLDLVAGSSFVLRRHARHPDHGFWNCPLRRYSVGRCDGRTAPRGEQDRLPGGRTERVWQALVPRSGGVWPMGTGSH
jgi:hypothetical protein